MTMFMKREKKMFVLNGSANKLDSYSLDLQKQDVFTNFHIQPALDVYNCI